MRSSHETNQQPKTEKTPTVQGLGLAGLKFRVSVVSTSADTRLLGRHVYGLHMSQQDRKEQKTIRIIITITIIIPKP